MSAEPIEKPVKTNGSVLASTPDLDVSDLFEQSSISGPGVDNPVMLPSAKCYKGCLLAQSDLFLPNGKLAVKMGQPLDQLSAELFARKQMDKNPLQIDLDKSALGLKQLIADFEDLTKKADGFGRFVEMNGGNSSWKKALSLALPASDFALVYLAQLRRHNIQNYEQSLFCSWMSAQLAVNMGLSKGKVTHLVLAGLFHQVGRLHLPETYQNLGENHCKAEEWNVVQSHVIYGKLLIKEAGDVGLAPVTEIIAQQGEYANSLGYPYALKQGQLREESVVLSLSRDFFQFLFVDGGSLADSLLFLQLHEVRFGEDASWALQRQIKVFLQEQSANTPSDCAYSEQMADFLIETSIVLAQLHVTASLAVRPVRLGLSKNEKSYLVERVVSLLQQIDHYKDNSGIVDIGFLASIDSMKEERPESLSDEIYQIIQRQRGLLTLFSEMDYLLESVMGSFNRQVKPEVEAEVAGLYGVIHDELQPFKNAMKQSTR
ncbi:MAG: hypothetical protein KUG83_06285 [Gammaproteobacteria bacterium]|nr:hypothetical protein [Gammaproteobacteria bacterium]